MVRGNRRGRPQKTSREALVESALQLLEAQPDAPLSINGLARSSGITPMSIYNYFEDKDDLLHAVSLRLLARLEFDIPEADLARQVRAWAGQLRDFLGRHPYAIGITGWESHISGGWLRTIAVLAGILARAGFNGQRRAETTIWLANEVMGAIYLEAAQQRSGVALRRADMALLEAPEVEALAPLSDYVKSHGPDRVFEFFLQRLLVSLEDYRNGRRREIRTNNRKKML